MKELIEICGFWGAIWTTVIVYGMFIYYYIKIPLIILGIIYLVKIIIDKFRRPKYYVPKCPNCKKPRVLMLNGKCICSVRRKK
jgi:hypothetical protein